MAGTPIRLPVLYPIGFFKSSEDLFGKFNGQGEKHQVDIFTAPENKTIFINPAAVKVGSKASLASILRYDHMDGKDGLKTELNVNTDELWNITAAYYLDAGGDEHRVAAQYGYASRDPVTGLRRICEDTQKQPDLKHVPAKLNYRMTAKTFQAQGECDVKGTWKANAIANFDGKNGVVGFNVGPGEKGIALDCGIGYMLDTFRGYVKLATGFYAGAPKNVTLLAHPTQTCCGVSCVAKAETKGAAPTWAGMTFSGPVQAGTDWKLGFKCNLGGANKGKIASNFALVKKLPNKWVAGVGFAIDDTVAHDINKVKFGIRLISGSTPLPL